MSQCNRINSKYVNSVNSKVFISSLVDSSSFGQILSMCLGRLFHRRLVIQGWFPLLGADGYFAFLSYSPLRFARVRLCAGSRGERFPHQNVPVLRGESSKAAAAQLGSLDGVQLPLAAGAHGQSPGHWSSPYPHQEHFCQRQVSVWRGKAQTFL